MRNPTSGVAVEGTLRADASVAMAIDPQGMAHVMSVLTNLYSNAPLAVVREYATNARDAHQAAGVTRPIEITLPTALDPTLRVRDFGAGLSEQDILGVYARYGSSTKRDSDEQVGAFGLGSKSAFTLAQQFVVTSVHGGRRTVVLFALGDDGVGAVSVLHRGQAGPREPSGVQIEVGVPGPELIRAAAARFFATWPAGSVLVDGTQPLSVRDGAVLACDQLVLADPQGEVTDEGWHLVMGGVSYPLPRELMLRAARADDPVQVRGRLGARGFRSVYATVPIGAVDITPSREGLRDTDRTLRAVRDVLDAVPGHLSAQVQAELDAAATEPQAVWLLSGYHRVLDHRMLPWGDLTYRGAPIRESLTVPLPTMRLAVKPGSRTRELRVDETLPVSPANLRDVLVVTDTPRGAARNGPARRYLMDNHNDVQRVVFAADSAAAFDWFAYGPGGPVPTLPYGEFRSRVEQYYTGAARRPTTYHTLTPQDAEPVDRPVPWLREQHRPPVVLPHRVFGEPLARHVFGDRPMVLLTGQQTLAGLTRRVPGTQDGAHLLRAAARRLVGDQSEDQRETVAASMFVRQHQQTARTIERLFGGHARRVPGLRELMADYRRAERICSERSRDLALLLRAYATAEMSLPALRPPDQTRLDDLLTRAPLLAALLRAAHLTDGERDAALAYLTTTTLPQAA